MSEDVYEEVKYYPEVCCNYCGQVVHNHIDCPVCEEDRVETTAYHKIEKDEEIACENCDTKFKVKDINNPWMTLELMVKDNGDNNE